MPAKVYNFRSAGRSFRPARRGRSHWPARRLARQFVAIVGICIAIAGYNIWSNGVPASPRGKPEVLSFAAGGEGAKVVRVAGASRTMPICGSGKRSNCVVDGDTLWLDGEKIRIEGMNAPETRGNCVRERQLAERAARRLSELLSSKSITIERSGEDVYGRTLATVRANGRDVAPAMVAEGLAHVWRGYKENWCA